MWNIQQGKMNGIPQADRQGDPTHQFMYDLMTQVANLKAQNFEVILTGDFNLNWKNKSPKVRLWKELIQNQDLVNIMDKWWNNETHKIHTYKQNETTTWIDYHLMSSALLL
jgi:exonuclease III